MSLIYLEHDSEITEAIEQLKAAEGDSVRIVVPGRSGLLQSVVNLKLLKKAARDSHKDLILVTSDKTATALAGKLEIPVAKNIKATPHVEAGEPEPGHIPQVDVDAAAAPALDDDDGLPVQRYDAPGAKQAKKDSRKAQKVAASRGGKIPNYNKFQLWIWAGAGIVALLLVFWLATAFLQTATIHVQATADRKDVNTAFVLSATKSGATTVTGQSLELSKDLSQTFQATGQKDVGTKASGSVSIKNCEDTSAHPIPAGTALSTSGKVFVTTAAATIPEGDFAGGGAVCKSSAVAVNVSAEANGDSYNFSGATFTIAGLSARITGTGTTSGGVSKKITVISQADIDGAQKAATEAAKTDVLNALKDKVDDDQKLFEDTLTTTVISATSNPAADAEAPSGTLSLKLKYTVIAAKTSDLTAMVKAALKDQLPSGGEVLDAGLDAGTFKQTKAGDGSFTYQLTTTAFVGQPIDKAALAKAAAGKSKKEVTDLARQYPNVTGTTVDAWALVPNMPSSSNNIKVEINISR